MPRLTPVLLISVGVLALAGCGGSSGLTKAQYDAKVNRLCLLASDQLRELHIDYSVGSWRHSGPAAVRVAQHFDHALAALRPPSDIASGAADFLKANEKFAADYVDGVTAAKAGNPATLILIDRRVSMDGAATARAAKVIGAAGCYIG